MLCDDFLELVDLVLKSIVDLFLLGKSIPCLLVLLFVDSRIIEGVGLGTLDVVASFRGSLRMTIVEHLLIILSFKLNYDRPVIHPSWIRNEGEFSMKDSLRDSKELNSVIDGRDW